MLTSLYSGLLDENQFRVETKAAGKIDEGNDLNKMNLKMNLSFSLESNNEGTKSNAKMRRIETSDRALPTDC
jgi:hypothetical protein